MSWPLQGPGLGIVLAAQTREFGVQSSCVLHAPPTHTHYQSGALMSGKVNLFLQDTVPTGRAPGFP